MGLITCIISKTFPKEALNVLEHNPRRTTHQGRESDESLSGVLVFSLNSCQLIVTFSFVLIGC